MSSKLRIVVAVIVVLIVGSAGYLLLTRNDSEEPQASMTSNETPSETPAVTQTETSQAAPAQEAGAYVDYSESALANAQGKRVLFFHAPWCPQCRQLDASIKAEGVPDGVTILKVDYDSNQKLRQKYGVTIQTTLVLLDENGNEVKKYVAYDQPTIEAVIQGLL